MMTQVSTQRKFPSLFFTGYWPNQKGHHFAYGMPRLTLVSAFVTFGLIALAIVSGLLFLHDARWQSLVTLPLWLLVIVWSGAMYIYSWKKVGFYEVTAEGEAIQFFGGKVRVLTPPISRQRFLDLFQGEH